MVDHSPIAATGADLAKDAEAFLALAGARSERTRRTYRAALRHFLEFLRKRGGGVLPPSPTLEGAREFAAWLARNYKGRNRALAERSRALYLVAIGRFYRFLIVTGRLPGVTLADYDNLRDDLRRTARAAPGPIERRLPEQEVVAALVEAARREPASLRVPAGEGERRRATLRWRRDLAVVLALESSGVRAGELVGLRRGDLDYSSHGAWVRGKGSKERFVRFSAAAWTAITAYLGERQDGQGGAALGTLPVFCRHDRGAGEKRLALSTRSVQAAIERLAVQAGILERFNMTPHKLRHFFATRLLRATNNLALVQDALGHASPVTTRVYARTTKEDLVAAHKKVFD